MTIMASFTQAHERLKNSIHLFWRQNRYLSPRSTAGKVVMSCLYFSIPVVIGYYVSAAAVELSESTVQERFGDTNVLAGARGSNEQTDSFVNEDNLNSKILGVGVHLVESDQQTQEVNRINLERFLKKQRRLKMKQQKAEQELDS